MEFLDFLESRKIITGDQKRLVENVMASSILFGVLALKENLVTPEQIERVILKQFNGSIKKIGEILVEEGILTEEEVKKILKKQKSLSVPCDGIIIDLGVLEEKELADAREAHRRFLEGADA
ncbi:MAG: hypothetical protein AB1742_00460 [bacterium]